MADEVYRQAVTAIDVSPEAMRAAFSHLVITDELFSAVGPAIVSGRRVGDGEGHGVGGVIGVRLAGQ